MLLYPPQMLSMMGELERIHGEQNSELNHMKKDTNRELALVGERNSAIMSDVKATLSAYKLSIENDRDRFEERVMSLLDRATGNWTSLLVGLLCLHNAWVFSASNITLIPFLCITRQKYWNPCDKLDKCGAFYNSTSSCLRKWALCLAEAFKLMGNLVLWYSALAPLGLFCVDSVYDLLTEFCNVLFFQYRKRWING